MNQTRTALGIPECRSSLVESVESGAEDEIVIARNGKPVARLVPIAAKADVGKRIGLWDGRYPVQTQAEFDADNDAVAAMFASKA